MRQFLKASKTTFVDREKVEEIHDTYILTSEGKKIKHDKSQNYFIGRLKNAGFQIWDGKNSKR